jgi:L-tyrosine peroxygenase
LEAVATALRVDTWDFGGYPYGLEPLVLPDPACRLDGGDLSPVERQLELMATATGDPGIRAESTEQLFWFRWIVGNQAGAAVWQILDDELELVLRAKLESAARNAIRLLDGYSVLLVYAGTPTKHVYHHLIRPAMARQHRSFSGRWAVDYLPVMTKLRTLRKLYKTRARPDFVEELIEAGKRNHRAHVAVAAKLVPGEDSLLRANDGLASLGEPTDETVGLYDAFYSTKREPVARERIVEQLISRLRAAIRDVRTNGMYPEECDSADEKPAELWGEELDELEGQYAEILQTTARAATAALQIPA